MMLNASLSFADMSLLFLPFVLPMLAAMAVLLATTAGGPQRPAPVSSNHLAVMVLLSLFGSMYAALQWPRFAGSVAPLPVSSLVFDGLASAGALVVLVAAAISTIGAMAYLQEHRLASGEYLALMLLSVVGALLTVAAGDLVTLFVGIELMSLCAYVLAGFRRAQARSQEAALKYFLFGAIGASGLLMGTALLWGESGRASGSASVSWTSLAALAEANQLTGLAWLGVGLVLLGLLFKVAAAPFHMWAPDVYEGAPTPAAGFLSTAVKAAGVFALVRVVIALLAPGHPGETAVQLIEVLAILSMAVGNLLAMRQQQLKRMLGYSSIAHVGYLLVGMAGLAAKPDEAVRATSAIAFYLVSYSAMGFGAFAVAQAFEPGDDPRSDLPLDRLAGAGRRHPALGFAMAVFLFGLMGLPPSAGFVGKWGLFGAALGAGRIGVVIIAALLSVVGAYAYLRVLACLFMRSESASEASVHRTYLTLTLWLCSAMTLILGIMPAPALAQLQALLAP